MKFMKLKCIVWLFTLRYLFSVCATNRFGEKCERICHCKDPGCDRVTGHCNKGVCEDSWTGDSCSGTLNVLIVPFHHR